MGGDLCLIHSTGHASRLNRPTLTESEGYGSNPYCKEELIAEMGAAFLCGQAEIAESTLENSAAYVQNWLEAFHNDNCDSDSREGIAKTP